MAATCAEAVKQGVERIGPSGVDPCGENGEFHTLVTGGPMFKQKIEVSRGALKVDPRFVYTDFQRHTSDARQRSSDHEREGLG